MRLSAAQPGAGIGIPSPAGTGGAHPVWQRAPFKMYAGLGSDGQPTAALKELSDRSGFICRAFTEGRFGTTAYSQALVCAQICGFETHCC